MSTERRTYEAVIERIVEHAPDTRSFFLRLPDTARLMFVPGQFISCLLPIAGETLIRPYSIASDPDNAGLLEICLNLVLNGPGSHYLFELEAGASVRFTGPWGTFILDRPPQAECVFIADGTGIAPIRPMLRRAMASSTGSILRLHYAVPSRECLLYGGEFETAARTSAGFTFEVLLSTALADVIEHRYVAADADRSRHFYICGVGGIVYQLRDLLRNAGYERRSVHYEKW